MVKEDPAFRTQTGPAEVIMRDLLAKKGPWPNRYASGWPTEGDIHRMLCLDISTTRLLTGAERDITAPVSVREAIAAKHPEVYPFLDDEEDGEQPA